MQSRSLLARYAMPGKPKVVYEFGGFRLDASRCLLQREGKMVPLPPKALDALILLIRHRDQVFEKQDLMKALWGDTTVEESNLTQQIFVLRKVLADAADGAQFIETIPRRGYRFIAAVTEHREEASGQINTAPAVARGAAAGMEPAGSRVNFRRAAVLALVCAATLTAAFYWLPHSSRTSASDSAPIRSIAVLPLENFTGDASQNYFADGITEAITGDLARIGSLRVISRASAMQYRGSHKAVPQIGRELHVDGVVEGTFTRSANRVRVTAELLDTRTDSHVWAQSFDRDLRDILTLQSELAASIAGQVAAKITPPERQVLGVQRAVDPAAHEAYLKGRFAWNERTEGSYLEAIRLFKEAVSHDPSYAAAYAGLADAYALLGSLPTSAIARSDAMEKARAAARRAIELDPSLAEAHTSLAFVLMHYDWKFAGAEKEFQLALRLNPSYATAHQWYAYDLMAMGRTEESLQENQRAQQCDPLSLIIATDRGELLGYAGKPVEAAHQFEEVVALDPNFALVHDFLATYYAQQGDILRATSEADRALVLLHGAMGPRFVRAYVAAKAGQKQAALRTVSALQPEALRVGSAYAVARVYMALNDVRSTVMWLQHALQQREGSLILLRVDPIWRPLRADPRFDRLLSQVGLPSSS